jgi:hypothetical protein
MKEYIKTMHGKGKNNNKHKNKISNSKHGEMDAALTAFSTSCQRSPMALAMATQTPSRKRRYWTARRSSLSWSQSELRRLAMRRSQRLRQALAVLVGKWSRWMRVQPRLWERASMRMVSSWTDQDADVEVPAVVMVEGLGGGGVDVVVVSGLERVADAAMEGCGEAETVENGGCGW